MNGTFSMLTNPAAGCPLLEPLRDSLRALLGVPCFIRRSRAENALFITDAVRKAANAAAMMDRLAQSGKWCAWREGDLLQLDPSPALWHELMISAPLCAERRPEAYPDYPFLASCALRLAAGNVPAEIQPVEPLRMTLKLLEAGELGRIQEELPRTVAVLQRNHMPLPEAAGLYILNRLKRGEEQPCC